MSRIPMPHGLVVPAMLCALLLGGCESSPRLKDEFAGGILQRAASPVAEGVWVYHRPGERITDYTGFMVERVQVYPYTGPATPRHDAPDAVETVAARAREALRGELRRHGYSVCDVPQRGVLRLKARIRARPIPASGAASEPGETGVDVPLQLVSMEVDLVDAVTRRRIYSIYDEDRASRVAGPVVVGTPAAEQAGRAWARMVVEHIDHEYWRGISAAGPAPERLRAGDVVAEDEGGGRRAPGEER